MSQEENTVLLAEESYYGPGGFKREIEGINKVFQDVDSFCKRWFEKACKGCDLGEPSGITGAVICGFPERINSTHQDNCTFESCPLIKRR